LSAQGANITEVTFTGHSLGGMNAQYAAALYQAGVVDNAPDINPAHGLNVNLVTIDAPGVKDILYQKSGEDNLDLDTAISNLDFVANDAAEHSLVSAMGGGGDSVGGNNNIVELQSHVQYAPAGSHSVRNFVFAIENGFAIVSGSKVKLDLDPSTLK